MSDQILATTSEVSDVLAAINAQRLLPRLKLLLHETCVPVCPLLFFFLTGHSFVLSCRHLARNWASHKLSNLFLQTAVYNLLAAISAESHGGRHRHFEPASAGPQSYTRVLTESGPIYLKHLARYLRSGTGTHRLSSRLAFKSQWMQRNCGLSASSVYSCSSLMLKPCDTR